MVVRCRPHRLRVVVGLVAHVGEHVDPVVDVLLRPQLAGLGTLTEETGVTVLDVQNRMVDFGIDAPWLSHEPWVGPRADTPKAGELWSKEDIDYWIDVLAHVCDEAYNDPETVRSAPHNHPIHKLDYYGRPTTPIAGRPRGGPTVRKHAASTAGVS